jgi:hypothetical protein
MIGDGVEARMLLSKLPREFDGAWEGYVLPYTGVHDVILLSEYPEGNHKARE